MEHEQHNNLLCVAHESKEEAGLLTYQCDWEGESLCQLPLRRPEPPTLTPGEAASVSAGSGLVDVPVVFWLLSRL